MATKSIYDRNDDLAIRASGSLGIGTAVLDRRLNPGLSRGTRLGRAGVVTLGSYGILNMINSKLNKAYQSKLRRREQQMAATLNKTASRTWFDGTELRNFVKTAADAIGPQVYNVPTKLAHDALTLYNMLPEDNTAAVTYELYKQAMPGMNKLAMKMIAANVVANAEKTAAIGALASSAGRLAGKALEPGMAALDSASKFKDRQSRDQNFYRQGSSMRG